MNNYSFSLTPGGGSPWDLVTANKVCDTVYIFCLAVLLQSWNGRVLPNYGKYGNFGGNLFSCLLQG